MTQEVDEASMKLWCRDVGGMDADTLHDIVEVII